MVLYINENDTAYLGLEEGGKGGGGGGGRVDAHSGHPFPAPSKGVVNQCLEFGADDGVELYCLGCRVEILGTNCDQCVSMVQRCFTSTETIRLITH